MAQWFSDPVRSYVSDGHIACRRAERKSLGETRFVDHAHQAEPAKASAALDASVNQNLTHQIHTSREKQLYFELP